MAALTTDHDQYECARAWAALTAAHAFVTEQLSQALTRAAGLSINDFEVLLRLDRVPGGEGLRINELRETVRLSQPAVSRMIGRLQAQGFIGRDTDPDDGRGVRVHLTDAGRDVLRRAVPVHAGTLRTCLLDRLAPKDSDQLSTILDRIVS